MAPLRELEAAYADARRDPAFRARARGALLRDFVGRPTPLTQARAAVGAAAAAALWLKREDLCHTGAHKINNALGQALLAKRMGKTRVVAETGAGQHGVATRHRLRAARPGVRRLHGPEDMARQAPERLAHAAAGRGGARASTPAARTLKDAINEAMRDWVTNVRTTHYLLGSVLGAHPVPDDGARFPGRHRRRGAGAGPRAVRARCPTSSWPASAAAPTRSASSTPSWPTPRRAWSAWRRAAAASKPGDHAARFLGRRGPGVLHGTRTTCCRTRRATCCRRTRCRRAWTIPAIGPEHAWLRDDGPRRATTPPPTTRRWPPSACSRETEGIIPALESSHALAWVLREAASLAGKLVLVNLAGRGDKDLGIIEGDGRAAAARRRHR